MTQWALIGSARLMELAGGVLVWHFRGQIGGKFGSNYGLGATQFSTIEIMEYGTHIGL